MMLFSNGPWEDSTYFYATMAARLSWDSRQSSRVVSEIITAVVRHFPPY